MANDFANKFKETGGAGHRPIQANIVVRVEGYESNAEHGGVVKGVVVAPLWMEGDTVAVRLTTQEESIATFRSKYTQPENDKFFRNRPTVEKFESGFKVGKNHIEPMAVGGLLMCHGSTKDLDAKRDDERPTWRSQYMENYGNDASRSVEWGMGRVSIYQNGERTNAYLDLLNPQRAVKVDGLDALRDFYADHMDGVVGGADRHPQSLIRVINGDQVLVFSTYAETVKQAYLDGDGVEKQASVSAGWEKTYQAAVENGTQSRGALKLIAVALGADLSLPAQDYGVAMSLRADLESGAATIEAIPGRRIPIVGASLEDLLDPTTSLGRLYDKGKVAVVGDDKKRDGFVKMAVSFMTNTARAGGQLPDSTIVCKWSHDPGAKPFTPQRIATPNFSSTYTQQREKEATHANSGNDDQVPQGLGQSDDGHESDRGAAAEQGGYGNDR